MFYCGNGMMKNHPGTGETHHLSDLFTHVWLVTVNRAPFARGLGITEFTMNKAGIAICCEGLAFRAQVFAAMILPTVKFDHPAHYALFFLDS